MEITVKQIKELRERTGAGVTNVKDALEQSKGDMEKAIAYLREKGLAKAAKRAGKSATNGFIANYMHGEGTIGVLVELNSETDFASRSAEFRALAREIAIHVAASNPEYVSIEDVPNELVAKEKEIAMKGLEKKPAAVIDKIVEGKMAKFYEEIVLMEQPFVKDESKKVKDLINEAVAAIGEKIEIGRFCRIQIAGPAQACGIE